MLTEGAVGGLHAVKISRNCRRYLLQRSRKVIAVRVWLCGGQRSESVDVVGPILIHKAEQAHLQQRMMDSCQACSAACGRPWLSNTAATCPRTHKGSQTVASTLHSAGRQKRPCEITSLGMGHTKLHRNRC